MDTKIGYEKNVCKNLYPSRKIWIFTFRKECVVVSVTKMIYRVGGDETCKDETKFNCGLFGNNGVVAVIFLPEK